MEAPWLENLVGKNGEAVSHFRVHGSPLPKMENLSKSEALLQWLKW